MVGLSSTQMWGYSVPEVLQTAADLGFTGVEVWAEHVWAQGDDPAAIRSRAEALGLHLSVHAASWDLNLTARNTGIRRASVAEVVRSIELAAAIGARSITVHPGRATLHGRHLEMHWELQAEAFQFLATCGGKCYVQVNVEVMEPIAKEFITAPEDANHLLALVNHPNLGVTFDIAHVPLHLQPLEVLRSLDRIDELHMSDSTATKLHVPLGKGEIDFLPILHELASRSVPIVLEGYESIRTTELATWNKQMFDTLWAKAQAAAS